LTQRKDTHPLMCEVWVEAECEPIAKTLMPKEDEAI
jgi:hypothetical protein